MKNLTLLQKMGILALVLLVIIAIIVPVKRRHTKKLVNEYCQEFYGTNGEIVMGVVYLCVNVKDGHIEKTSVSQIDFELWKRMR